MAIIIILVSGVNELYRDRDVAVLRLYDFAGS